MLLKLEGKDHVSIEVRYHLQRCFRPYTAEVRVKRLRLVKPMFSSDPQHSSNTAFRRFCETVLKPRVIDG
jgi:hypothetical protein